MNYMRDAKYGQITYSGDSYATLLIMHDRHDISSIQIAAQEICDVSYVMIDVDENNNFSVTLKPKDKNDVETIIKRFCGALELRTKDKKHSMCGSLKDDIFLEWDRQTGAIRKEPGELL